MRLIIQPDAKIMAQWAANYIASKINKAKPTASNPFVLGLPTGSTPLKTYKELIKLCERGVVSFENVVTFNMDEYVGLGANHPQSYHTFMWSNFFDHIDIKKENVHILNGMTADLEEECTSYEKAIKDVGGVDLFLGGLGSDGHIAFNEPGSSLSSRTRIKTLTTKTVIDNSRFFDNDVTRVPKTALTVGIGTILEAKEVVILVDGRNKANALHQAVEGSVNQMWTISALQMHQKGMIICDYEACIELKVGTYKYFLDIERDHLDPDTLLV